MRVLAMVVRHLPAAYFGAITLVLGHIAMTQLPVVWYGAVASAILTLAAHQTMKETR